MLRARTRERSPAPSRSPALLPILVLAALTPAASPPVAAQGGDAILGHWLTDDDEATVEITRRGDTYHGTIVALDEPLYPPDDEGGMAGERKVDRENPDPELRDRPIIGLEILRGLRFAGEGRWQGGRIYDPKNGKTYSLKAHLTEGGVLKMRGFIGFSLLGRTTEWRRPPQPPGAPSQRK